MKTPRTTLAAVIGERTLHETDLKKLARAIAAYLLSEKRENELDSLIRDIMAYRQAHGVVEATVHGAHDLGAVVEKDVKQLLKAHYPDAKHIVVRPELDPSVIGGVRVQLANEQLDLSVRAKLDTFKRLTSEGAK